MLKSSQKLLRAEDSKSYLCSHTIRTQQMQKSKRNMLKSSQKLQRAKDSSKKLLLTVAAVSKKC